MTFRAWGLVTAVTLAQLCAGVHSAVANSAGSTPPARPAWCPSKHAGIAVGAPLQLSALSAKLRDGAGVKVVAIGSSSTEGSDLPDQLLAYPTQLQRQLAARLGHGRVKLVNKGRGGETMIETVARFSTDVANEKPDLVIWQLGVNDVVRGQEPSVSERTIEDGMLQLRRLGAPVVLMDMQLAPRVTASAQLPNMKKLLKSAAQKHQALLWSRFDLMDGIVRSGSAQLADLVKPDDLHMTVAMHVCTGAVLADVLAESLAAQPAGDLVASRTP